MMSEEQMEQPTLTTARLVLRLPVAADAQSIFDTYGQDPEVTRFLTWQPHQSVADSAAVIERMRSGSAAGTAYSWLITRQDDGALLGSMALRPTGFKADVGYLLAPAAWGQGYMTEALTAVIAFAWTLPGIYRVWAVCDVDNPASGRVMEKAGMSFEGRLRRWTVHPNVSAEPRDVLCYSVVR